MADSTKPTPTDDDAATPAPGTSDPTPTVPDASIEPAAQVASAMATDTMETPRPVTPPIPADYEMPDDYANEGSVDKAKAWAEAHPGLAVLAAAGVGLLVGRIVTGLIPDSDPPSLADRVEKKAKVLKKQAKKQGKDLKKQGKHVQARASSSAHDAGESLQDLLDRASKAVREAAENAGDVAEDGLEKTKDLAEHLSDAVKLAVTGVLATKIDDWVKR